MYASGTLIIAFLVIDAWIWWPVPITCGLDENLEYHETGKHVIDENDRDGLGIILYFVWDVCTLLLYLHKFAIISLIFPLFSPLIITILC